MSQSPMSAESVAVAFLKAKILALYLVYSEGPGGRAAMASARGFVVALISILNDQRKAFSDFLQACEDLDVAEANGAVSTRMDNASDGAGDAFRALAKELELEAAATPASPDLALFEAGVATERARWTWKTDGEISAAIRIAVPNGRIMSLTFITGAVNESFDGYSGPVIPVKVIAAILNKMPKALEVEPGKWAIAE